MTLRIAAKNLLARIPWLDGQFRRLIWSRIHFPEGELRFLDSLPSGSIDIAIDVGAALGSYSWILSRKATQVFAFEPGGFHGNYLANLTSRSNITLVRSAVGAVSGSVLLYTPGLDENARHSATLSTANPVTTTLNTVAEPVNQVSLDGYFRGKLSDGRAIDLLKVDIEGYELQAFRGARELISKFLPLIICEIEKRHNEECFLTFDLLRSFGYECFIFKQDKFIAFDQSEISSVQTEEALQYRIGPNFNPAKNTYINNFVFQHPQSRIKVVAQ